MSVAQSGISGNTPHIDKWITHKTGAAATGKRLLAAASLHGNKPYVEGRALRMQSCCDVIAYQLCPACGKLHLAHAGYCRDRLCPLCAWRLSVERTRNMMLTLDYLAGQRVPLNSALLTLTMRNCQLGQLRSSIDQLLSAWHLLTRRRKVSRHVLGYCRSLEVSRGRDGTSLHPHMHVLLFLPEGYAADIHQREWCAMWQQSLGVDYTPVVDIRKTYAQQQAAGSAQWQAALASSIEALKYAVKPSLLEGASPQELIGMLQGMHGVRLVSYGGIIKDARKAVGITGADAITKPEAIVHCPDCGAIEPVLMAYRWAANTYAPVK